VKSEIRFERWLAHPGDHFAVTVRVKAIDHHPIVADQPLDLAGHGLAEHLDGGGAGNLGDDRLETAREGIHVVLDENVRDRRELENDALEGDAMQHPFHRVDIAVGTGKATAKRDRALETIGGEEGAHRVGQWRAHLSERGVDECFDRSAKKRGRVRADVTNGQRRLVQYQQHPVRLDRPGEVNQLTLAVGEIRRSERGMANRVAHVWRLARERGGDRDRRETEGRDTSVSPSPA
jgi:hypothetical protein